MFRLILLTVVTGLFLLTYVLGRSDQFTDGDYCKNPESLEKETIKHVMNGASVLEVLDVLDISFKPLVMKQLYIAADPHWDRAKKSRAMTSMWDTEPKKKMPDDNFIAAHNDAILSLTTSVRKFADCQGVNNQIVVQLYSVLYDGEYRKGTDEEKKNMLKRAMIPIKNLRREKREAVGMVVMNKNTDS